MREQHDRGAARQSSNILLQPCDLLGTERAESTCLEIENVHEADESHAAVVEAVPAATVRVFPVALEVRRTVVRRDVVLPGHIEDAIRLYTFQHFVRRVELVGFGELRDVAGVEHEGRLLWERVELRYGLLESGGDVLVRLLAEADVTVADLREEDALALRVGHRRQRPDWKRCGDPAFQTPDDSGAGPCHAAEAPATVDAVVALVGRDVVAAV